MNLMDIRVTLTTLGDKPDIIRERTGKVGRGSSGMYDFLNKELGLSVPNGAWGPRGTIIVPVKPEDVANAKDRQKWFDRFDAAVAKFFKEFGYQPGKR